jgi:cysteine desulfurase
VKGLVRILNKFEKNFTINMRSFQNAQKVVLRLQGQRAMTKAIGKSFSTVTIPPSTMTFEKMSTDKRYQVVSDVPQEVMDNMFADTIYSPGFSIKGESIEGRAAYLDFQATTPQDPRVLDAMMPFMVSQYGNPHSRTHTYGWETEAAVETAREEVAKMIGCTAKEIIFTSGATESNNMAIKGVARFYKGKKNHVITTQTEHKCVLDSCRALEQEGFDVTYLPVLPNGLVDMQLLKDSIRPDTCMVSVMGVNNEIGVIQPLKEMGELCRKNKVFFHSDLAQMVGKMPVNVDDLNIDLASISSHKIYGPKGIGALYVRRRPRVRLEPLFSGGGQERGLRSGTLSPSLCVGMGAAARICTEDLEHDTQWIAYLAEKFRKGVMSRMEHVVLNGDPDARYVGNLNFSFAYVEGESLLMALKNIAVSSGSACTSASLEPSYVLRYYIASFLFVDLFSLLMPYWSVCINHAENRYFTTFRFNLFT